jgi:hypothetical protein
MSGEDEFINRAVQIALADAEEQLIRSRRDYEDSLRYSDEHSGAAALSAYAEAKAKHDTLTQANQTQNNNNGQLSNSQRNFLSRRQAGGDELTESRMRDYQLAHNRALAAGLQVDSPQYFNAVEWYCDHNGDGKQPPLNEREAARIAGVDEQTYARHAQTLRALKARGHYSE